MPDEHDLNTTPADDASLDVTQPDTDSGATLMAADGWTPAPTDGSTVMGTLDASEAPTLIDIEAARSPDDTEPVEAIEVAPRPTSRVPTGRITPDKTPATEPTLLLVDSSPPAEGSTGSVPPKPDLGRTMVGSGGLDPNPDFAPRAQNPPRPPVDHTQPHIVPLQHTQIHVPDAAARPRATVPPAPRPAALTLPNTPRVPPPPRNEGRPLPPPSGMTQPTLPQQYSAPYQQTMPNTPAAPPPDRRLPPRPAAGAPPRRRRLLGCSPGCLMVFLGLMVTFCGGLTLITLVLTATLGADLENELQIQVAQIDDYDSFQSTFFYDRNGTLLYEAYTEGRRTNVRYEDFPPELINATIAIEDDSFFTNPGFEVQATGRAFLQYVGLSEGSTGGSTITQQLVRNVLFDQAYRSERSIQRKVEEIMLAFLLTQRRSKPDILALYLNEIYYGNRAYGAEAAARTFFDKSVNQLTLGEAALLAGLPQAPAYLDPFSPDSEVTDAVLYRWREVLDRMVAEGFITQTERDATIAAGLSFNPPTAPLRAPHFTVYAQSDYEQLMESIGVPGETVARGGYRVFTTVDLSINNQAQQIAAGQVANLAANGVSNAAVVVMQPLTGEILGMVGSIDYDNDAIDGRVNVATSLRQPGSTMKPFTYAAALEMGMSTADVLWDTPVTITGFDSYTPVNYDRAFHGPVRIRTALANSYNVPAVQTLRTIGVENFLNFLPRFGITSLGTDASLYGLSLTLGGGEITLLELTNGYATFANGGAHVPAAAILCVLDNQNRIVYQYENGCPRGDLTDTTINQQGYGQQAIDPRIAYFLSDVLADNGARTAAMGPNSPLNTGALASSVKTGTTDDFRDNWTVGYTRNVAVGIWVGNSDGTPMINSSGLTGAAPIWNAIMTGIHDNPDLLRKFALDGGLLSDQLDVPPGMSRAPLCSIPQLRDPAADCSASIQEWVLDGPAGVPDGQGGITYPAPEPANDQPPAAGPYLREVEPSIYRVVVQPIAPEVAAGIQFAVQPGQPQPPPPLYCQVPVEAIPFTPNAREQVFIAPPPVPEDAVSAEQYARNNGLAFLPSIACSTELLNAAPGAAAIGYTAIISSPAPGETLFSGIPIIGTASFPTGQGQYYKFEITGGQFGGEWRTLSDVRYDNVVGGQLDYLPDLQPGAYSLRLIIVGNDGNFASTYDVAFNRG